MDELVKILIGISGTVLGGFLGYFLRVFIEHRLAIDRIKETIKVTEFSKAAAKLRAAFAPAKAHLKFPQSLGNIEAREFFGNALTNHAIAIEVFRPFAKDSSAYQGAWEDYQNTVYGDDALGDADLKWSSGMITSENAKENLNFLKVIEDKIENILHFASPNK